MSKTYKHKAIRHYTVGRFEFKNFICRVEDSDVAEFEALVQRLPPMRARQIVIFDEDAAARVEQHIGSSVVRGATDSVNLNAGEAHRAGESSASEKQKAEAGANANPVNNPLAGASAGKKA